MRYSVRQEGNMSISVWLSYRDGRDALVPAHAEDTVRVIRMDPKTGREVSQMTGVASATVTGNYARLLHDRFAFSWSDLNGKTGRESVPILAKIVEELGTEPSGSYWDATPGNVGRVAARFLLWALLHPEAIWGTPW